MTTAIEYAIVHKNHVTKVYTVQQRGLTFQQARAAINDDKSVFVVGPFTKGKMDEWIKQRS